VSGAHFGGRGRLGVLSFFNVTYCPSLTDCPLHFLAKNRQMANFIFKMAKSALFLGF
jgi:hypothetical protein